MPGLSEECACGARFEVTDAHWPQAVSAMKIWRERHTCAPKQGTMDFMAIDTSRSEIPLGFTRGLRIDTPDIEIDEDPENRTR